MNGVDLYVTRQGSLFALREGNVQGVVRVKAEDAQGINDYAATMYGVGTVLNWAIGQLPTSSFQLPTSKHA